ncbi:MAG: AEC family transporter, partial [bacterium]|nr:AEC family transporter [bacterium]
ISSLLLKLTLPAMIIDSMQKPFTTELLKQSGTILFTSTLVYGVSYVFSGLMIRALKTPVEERGIFRFALMFSNVGFMGYPVVAAVLGQDAIFFTAIYNLPFHLLLFTLGVLLLTRNSKEKVRARWSMLVNPAVISVFIGFFLFISSWKLPSVVAISLHQIGGLTSPLSMLLIGSMLASSKISEIFGNWRLYSISIIRLVMIPTLVWAGLKLFGSSALMLGVPVVIAAMPIAANAAILAEEYDANSKLASQAVFISTLLSIVTIPLMVYLLF